MTKLKSTPYTRIPTPTSFKTKADKDRYWDGELKKWIEGYSGLTGLQYFYMQEWTLKNILGQAIRPYFKDTDMLQAEAFEMCVKKQWDLLIIKRREAGLTSMFGGCAPVWNMLINPGATSLLTSCDTGRIKGMFNDKLIYGFDKLHPDIRPPKLNTREFGYLNLGTKSKGENNDWEESPLGKVVCKETTLDPTVFESERSTYGFVDEAALHSKLQALKASMQPCFLMGSKKYGTLVLGGSIGEEKKGNEQSKQNIESIRKLYKDAEALNIATVFIPGNMGILEFSNNGWSDTKAADEWIDKELERLSKAEDKTEYNNFKRFYPRTIDEALGYSSAGGYLDEDLMFRISAQEKKINETRPPIANYRLSENDDGTIKSVPSTNGKFRILYHPEVGKKYIGGIDPVPFTDSNEGEGSDCCLVIKDFETNEYIAFYKFKSSQVEVIAEDMIFLQEYYNNAVAMLEINRGGEIKEKYRDFGKYHLLANRPQNLGVKFVDKRIKKGYFKNVKTAPRLYTNFVKYLSEGGIEQTWFIEFLNDYRVFLQQNTDIADSVCMCEIFDKSEVKKLEVKYQKPQTTMQRRIVMKDGKTTIEWVSVQVS